MGLLSGMFGGKEEHPPLPDDNDARSRIDGVRRELQKLSAETKDRLEVVPSEHAAYVFVGKPPKSFGLAWIHDGKISNLAALAQEKKFNPIKRERIDDELRSAYERSASADRYSYSIEEHNFVVTPSLSLAQEVHRIIDSVFS